MKDPNRHKKANEESIEMQYKRVQSNKWTFQSDKIREWVEKWLRGRVLNACCGKTRLQHGGEVVRNDIDTDIDADYHVDAANLDSVLSRCSFDTVVFDPPFSVYQANHTYNGETTGYDTSMKKVFDKLLRGNGRVIQFGYTTTCMPVSNYERKAVCVFNTLGRMNDWLAVVDERVDSDLSKWGAGNK